LYRCLEYEQLFEEVFDVPPASSNVVRNALPEQRRIVVDNVDETASGIVTRVRARKRRPPCRVAIRV